VRRWTGAPPDNEARALDAAEREAAATEDQAESAREQLGLNSSGLRVQWLLVILAVPAAVAAAVGIADRALPGDDDGPDASLVPIEEDAGTTTVTTQPPTTPTSLPGTPLAELIGCPIDPIPAEEPQFEICVVMWCQSTAPRNQQMVKIKPKLVNRSDLDLDISLNAPTGWRLIVPESTDVGAWSPPGETGDAPMPLAIAGENVWGIPPNADRDSEAHPSGGITFATHWDAVTLPAGDYYLDPDNREGDLVFYVPDSNPSDIYGTELLGLAFVVDGTVVAYTPVIEWGPRADPNDF
jgi:hypothetical protein